MPALKVWKENSEDSSIDWRDLPGFVEVHDYLQSLRQSNDLPRAEDVDLLQLLPWLPEISLFDRVKNDEIICRFVGTAIVDRLSHDISGKNIYPQQSAAMRDRTRDAFECMIKQPCGMVAHYTTHYNTGLHGAARTLYLPLIAPVNGFPRLLSIANREGKSDYAPPIEQSVIATDVVSITWIDVGFGMPQDRC